jgi:hypothetical protein
MRLVLGICALIGSVVVVSWLLETREMSGAIRLGLALVPVAAYVFCLVLCLRLLRGIDELQRRIHLEALVVAFPSTLVAVFACEYLRKAGIISQFKPDYILTAMMVFWGIGLFIAWRRYQ